ncbi:MAG TPA: hypothetical protein VHR44_11050 [Beijerinckiaceae bacterium]|nr:hypothetical protein [Beijerinckiaceae bacterium]
MPAKKSRTLGTENLSWICGRGRRLDEAAPGALIDEIAARAKLLPPLKKRAAEIVREMREEER